MKINLSSIVVSSHQVLGMNKTYFTEKENSLHIYYTTFILYDTYAILFVLHGTSAGSILESEEELSPVIWK